MNLSYLDPRRIARESIWFLVGVAMVLAAAWSVPSYLAGLVVAILPTLAMLAAASRSILPALLSIASSALLAITGTALAGEVGLLGLALGLIFAAQRVVERLQARTVARHLEPGT